MRSASVTPGRHPRPGSSSISVPKVTAGTAVCRHVAAILVLPIRRPAWQKAASCQVCFAAGVTCFCLGTQSLAKNSSGSRHTAPRTPATCGVAIASARVAYQRHLAKFTGPEWERLRKLGARRSGRCASAAMRKSPCTSALEHMPDESTTLTPRRQWIKLAIARVDLSGARLRDAARDALSPAGRR
jgi:hypothetical protein